MNILAMILVTIAMLLNCCSAVDQREIRQCLLEVNEAMQHFQECQMSWNKAISRMPHVSKHQRPNAKAEVERTKKALKDARKNLLLKNKVLQQTTEDFNKQQTTAPMTAEPDLSVASSISDASSEDLSMRLSISDASSQSVKSSISDASSQPVKQPQAQWSLFAWLGMSGISGWFSSSPQPPSYQDVLSEKAAEAEARRISGKKAQEDRMHRAMNSVWSSQPQYSAANVSCT